MFNSAHRLVGQIRSEGGYAGSTRERRLADSVASALVTTLQSLSLEFRTLQGGYLNKLNLREERSKAYFDVDLNPGGNAIDDAMSQDDAWQCQSLATLDDSGKRVESFQQLLLLESNTQEVQTREKEVERIVKSIVELNELFKDISQIVVDQGTVLDRIDYNIEAAQVEVGQGLKQLQRAAQHQRSGRKMVCIVVLGVVTSLMTGLLIITKL